MNALESMLAHPFAQALGWALLHFIWQGVLVAIVLAGALAVLRGSTANVRYGVSCAALLLMLALPIGTILVIGAQEQPAASSAPATPPTCSPRPSCCSRSWARPAGASGRTSRSTSPSA